MADKHPKRPRDFSQAAKLVIDIAAGERPNRDPTPEEQGKDPAAVALGRRGGLRGGKARAAKMTAEQRAESPLLVSCTQFASRSLRSSMKVSAHSASRAPISHVHKSLVSAANGRPGPNVASVRRSPLGVQLTHYPVLDLQRCRNRDALRPRMKRRRSKRGNAR
jgi:hypothetical protein